MAKIFLTALRVSPEKHEDRAVPEAYPVETADIVKQVALTAAGGVENTHIKILKAGGRYTKTLKVAEKLGEVFLMADYNNAASSPYNTGTKANIAPAGATTKAAGATAPATAYHSSVTTGTATSAAISLPAASTWTKQAKVIKNAASVAILVYSTGSDLMNGASTNSTSIPAGQFRHFYASASGQIVTAKGPYL